MPDRAGLVASEGTDRPGPAASDGGPHGRRSRVPRWAAPVGLGIVLVVSLAIGSGIGRGHPTVAQRAAAIEAQVRCPSCEDLSVLQSSASAAVAVRNQITREVARGWSDGEIEDALVARYGPTILLRPPTTGLTSLVWIVPAVAGAAAVVAVGTLFWRRARQMQALRREGPS